MNDSIADNLITSSLCFKPLKLTCEISITDADGFQQRFDPMDDATPVEAMRFSQMFAVASTEKLSFAAVDYWGFIVQHKLERHFLKAGTIRISGSFPLTMTNSKP